MKGDGDHSTVLRNETDESLLLPPGGERGVFMLTDPRPAPTPDLVTVESHAEYDGPTPKRLAQDEGPPTIYLASSFSLSDRVQSIYESLEGAGFSVPDVWWNEDLKEIDLPDDEWYDHEDVAAISKRHWRSIETSDVYVLVAPEDEPKKYNGANIELGYALAHGCDCYAVGEIERSAMYRPVTRCPDVDELLDALRGGE